MPLGLPVIMAIIGAAGSAAGGALANRGKQTSTSTPTVAPEYQGLQGNILQMIQQRLGADPNLTGYEGSGVAQINQGFNTTAATQENDLTRRGLATSPIAANVDATRNAARAGAVTDFRNSVPLLARSLQTQDLGLGTNLLNMGRGVTSTGTMEGGGGAAGAFTNLAQYLGYLSGKGMFGKTPGAAQPGTNGGY